MKNYTQEELIAFGKKCFYKGFSKAEEDANCYTAFREEIGELLSRQNKRQHLYSPLSGIKRKIYYFL